ncbi:hypothetical protein T01_3750 [Trichinella spiralis]|uniref:Uncharacterized protein n=1 Tax=Trichinella spiralis TaxID=6334 RepID=A0A0V1AZZ7_TRISP|nr:hypothetical protein T01_3750 [Trichinella spiralis]
MSVLYVFIRDGAEKEARFLENCKISWAMDLATFTLIDENVMQSFIGNCPVIVELMASKCGDLPVEYNSSPLHYLIDSLEEASCKFSFVCSLYAYLA